MSRVQRLFVPALVTLLVAACASSPPPLEPSSSTPALTQPHAALSKGGPDVAHLAAAKRFLHGIGAGDIAMAGLKGAFETQAKEQPGMAELARRAFAHLKPEDFEDLAANVYVRHLSKDNLEALANFIEGPTGNRFFRSALEGVLEGKKSEPEDLSRQFNADELTEIMRFSLSDVFSDMQKKLPLINKEMAEEGAKLGEKLLREYVRKTST